MTYSSAKLCRYKRVIGIRKCTYALTEIKMAYFDDMFNEMNKKIEKEADAYAKQMLIQDSLWKSSGLRITSSTAEIKAFASQLRINPAIPAGRLRYENKNYSVFTNLIGNGAVREMFK